MAIRFDLPSHPRIELRPRAAIWIERPQLAGSASDISASQQPGAGPPLHNGTSDASEPEHRPAGDIWRRFLLGNGKHGVRTEVTRGPEIARRLVIIGGDAAGMSAAAQARRMTSTGELEIVVAFERSTRTSYAACGLPYLVGGFVKAPDSLVARTPQQHRANGIDVRTRHEVVSPSTPRRRRLPRSTSTPLRSPPYAMTNCSSAPAHRAFPRRGLASMHMAFCSFAPSTTRPRWNGCSVRAHGALWSSAPATSDWRSLRACSNVVWP
jgi:hypothetical protein